MNFEELYEKYLNKTATEEEVLYVESEIAKAKKLAALIDERDASRVIAPTESNTAKRSVKTFLKKTRLRVAAIVFVAMLVLSALAVGTFFTAATIKASSNSVCDKAEAIELCKKWMAEVYDCIKPEDLFVEEADRDLALHHGFSRAYYEYDIEINYRGNEYEFWVDSATGEVRLVDRD